MTEKDRIVAWLRSQLDPAERIDDRVNGLINAIERGDHLIRPEPTIPASEWLPKSNLTY